MITKCLQIKIPLPTADNEGIPFPSADIKWFEGQLTQIGGGYRKHRWVEGAWNGGGKIDQETVVLYACDIEPTELHEIQKLAAEARSIFRQEAILVEVMPVIKFLVTGSGGDQEMAEVFSSAGEGHPNG